MLQKEPVAPFVRQWDGCDHIHFLSWARELYSQDKHDSHPHRKNRRDRYHCWHLAYRIWRIGRSHYVMHKSMDEFWAWIEPVEKRYNHSAAVPYQPPFWNRQKRRYTSNKYEDWYPRNGAHFRCKTPLNITEKKVRSERYLQKKEWRKERGIDRDKARGRRRHWGPRTWAKRTSNKCFRHYENQMVHIGNHEKLFTGKRKDYFDPWMWD
jgi:hypothetical protein